MTLLNSVRLSSTLSNTSRIIDNKLSILSDKCTKALSSLTPSYALDALDELSKCRENKLHTIHRVSHERR